MKNRSLILIVIGALFFAFATDSMAKGKSDDSSDDCSSDSSSDSSSDDCSSDDGSDDSSDDQPRSTSGMVIFDMTANPGDVAITTNLSFVAPGSKADSAIDDGFGFNTINIEDFHVLSRDRTKTPEALRLRIGESSETVSENQLDQAGESTFFADGNHLFDLDRIRAAADWMAKPGNLVPDSGVPAGSYGTISFGQLLNNVDVGRTMYGIVRVKVPLELGTCTSNDNCGKNSLGAVVDKTTIYGLCKSNDGLCSCAPANGYKIQEGKKKCDADPDKLSDLLATQIRVKGSLFWDFVASEDNASANLLEGDPVPFSLLPWAPRELYFKVEVPIGVNWEYDLDGDGAMDNMFNIANVSDGSSQGILNSPSVTWAMVAPTNKAEFEFANNKPLTEVLFDTLDDATKYHLMMPNGYTTGWAEAFDKLNITGSIWQSIPVTPAFGLPTGFENQILTADVVRSENFEDIPAYLYSGGLIDMHDHVNVSGLLYAPQGMELEAKNSTPSAPTRQYVAGAIVVRDTFFIEAKQNTVTVISSQPTTYSTALREPTPETDGGGPPVVFVPADDGSSNDDSSDDDSSDDDSSDDCSSDDSCSSPPPGGPPTSSGPDPKKSRWIEVRPQVEDTTGDG